MSGRETNWDEIRMQNSMQCDLDQLIDAYLGTMQLREEVSWYNKIPGA